MTEINIVHTPCKQCVFADYKDNTQTGCLLKILEKYENVISAYDEEKEFYIVNGKKCPGYKEQPYFDRRNMSESTIEEKIKYTQDNVLKLKYLAIIDCKERTPEQLMDVLNELNKSSVKPEFITIVTYQGSEHSFNDYYLKLNKSKIGCKWKIKGLVYKDQDLITTAHQSININAENCNFVLCVGKDYTNLSKIIDAANEITYNKLSSFVLLCNQSKDVLLFNQFVYKSALAHNTDIITDTTGHVII